MFGRRACVPFNIAMLIDFQFIALINISLRCGTLRNWLALISTEYLSVTNTGCSKNVRLKK